MTLGTLFEQTWISLPYAKSMHSGWWFMGRRFLKIYQNFPYLKLA